MKLIKKTLFSYFSDWSKEVLELCKEFKGEGVVGIDLAGQEFHPGVHPDDCAHKRVFAVSSFRLYLFSFVVVVVVLLFYVHSKHLRSCRDGQLT